MINTFINKWGENNLVKYTTSIRVFKNLVRKNTR